MTAHDRIERILELARKQAQEAEVFYAAYEQTPVIFEANRLKHMQTRQGNTVALRIVRNGKTGLATTTRLDDIASLVDKAVAVSEFGSSARFEFPERTQYPQVDVFDAAVDAYPIERMVELGQELVEKVRGHTPELLCDASVSKAVVSMAIVNSRGGRSEFKRSSFSMGLEGNLIRDTDMLFVGDGAGSCQPVEDIDGIAALIIRQLEQAKRTATLCGGNLPVVFTPHGVLSSVLAPLAAAFNGKIVLQGASPVGHRQGAKLFDVRLSLTDDGLVRYRPSSRPCDDEGVPSRVTRLIRDGVVGDFLYDLQTAGLAGTQSTGNADRGGGAALPAPSTSGLVFQAGDISYDDMVRDMEEGLVVEQLMGASQTNILGGEFSGNVLLGFKVEKGEIVGRVKDTVVSGNVYEAFNNLLGIGRETRWIGSVLAPAIGFSRLAVGCKGGSS